MVGAGRSPRGERGLKLYYFLGIHLSILPGRSPRGERGLKCFFIAPANLPRMCRSPRGERGLK